MKVKYICMSARACALETESASRLKRASKLIGRQKCQEVGPFRILIFFLFFFSFSFIFVQKILIASRIQTRIVRVEGKNADH